MKHARVSIAIWVLGKPILAKHAREYLVRLGFPVVKSLIAILNHPNRFKVGDAVRTLGSIGDLHAVEPLINLLNNSSDPYICLRSAEALGEIGDQRADSALGNVLGRVHPDVDDFARYALQAIRFANESELLVAFLQDADVSVRCKAAWELGQLGHARAVEPLLPFIDDPDVVMRQTVIEALGQIGNQRALSVLDRVARHDKTKTRDGIRMAEIASSAIAKIRKRNR